MEPKEGTGERSGCKKRNLWIRVMFRRRCILWAPVSICYGSKLGKIKGKVDVGSEVGGGEGGKTNDMLLAAEKVSKDIANSINIVKVCVYDVKRENICNCGKV
eukprot:8625294-Ditylum_brightwellii.AAC.1